MNVFWSIKRLIICIRNLGIRVGYKYWNIENAAIRNPEFIPAVCSIIKKRANKLRVIGNNTEADLMDKWADAALKLNEDFHKRNNFS